MFFKNSRIELYFPLASVTECVWVCMRMSLLCPHITDVLLNRLHETFKQLSRRFILPGIIPVMRQFTFTLFTLLKLFITEATQKLIKSLKSL